MNIKSVNAKQMYKLTMQQMAVNTLMGQNKSSNKGMDMFIRSNGVSDDVSLYSSFTVKKSTHISEALLLRINNNVSGVKKHGDVYEYEGNYFTAQQIPKINTSTLSEIKAYNNTLDFGQNNYFKYVSSDGKEHALFTDDGCMNVVYSEHMRGAEYDATASNYSRFWRYMMSKDPVYYGLTWSDGEVREFMSEAGIENGFFTIKMGEREATQYYSASKTAGVIHSKERYDSKYEHITSTGYHFMNYEPGSVFKLNGKEYILSENHTLDIPYGEDLWCLEYPSNYVYGEKIN